MVQADFMLYFIGVACFVIVGLLVTAGIGLNKGKREREQLMQSVEDINKNLLMIADKIGNDKTAD
jgi:hypothetical protein